MSDLLNQASLVMVPSGYKEDTVYSVVPSDGSGDLSFTRASNGTRINSAGLVEVTPWNLVENSEQFNGGTWSSAYLSISANATTAPNGTTTADLIYPSSSQAYCYISSTSFNVVAGQTYTQSVYFKRSGFRWGIVDNMAGSPGAWFDLLNGVVGNVSSGCTASIESVGDGWYRCSVSSVAPSSTNYADFRMSDSNGGNAVTANGTDGLYVWGFQLNIGTTAKPYFPTTDRLNVPRLTYQNGGGGCPSLLLEKQSTNELSYSEELDNAAWTVKDNSSVTANATTSPDGTTNADKLVEDSSNNQHRVYRTIDGTNKSFSFFAKAGERSWLAALSNDGNFTYFDIANGVLGTVASGSTASITAFGNGWFRCVLYNAHGTYGALIQLALANNGTSYQGNGTSGAFVWGCQMEASSYPTSYIPTTSSSATRVADACFKTGISSLIGQTQGTIFWDINFVADGTEQTINISDGTNFIYLQKYTDNKIYTGVYNGSFVGSITSSVLTSGRKKIAFGYILNSLVLYINGVLIGTDLTSTIPTCDRLSLTVSNTGSIETNNFILFPTKLTNAELASLTTI